MITLPLPALALPGYRLLAHALLFAVAAALLVGVTLGVLLVGQVVGWGVRRWMDYWRGQPQ